MSDFQNLFMRKESIWTRDIHVRLSMRTATVICACILFLGTVLIIHDAATNVFSAASKQPKYCKPEASLGKPKEFNEFFVQQYPIGDSLPYLDMLGLENISATASTEQLPVIVTAVSSNYFSELNSQVDRLTKDVRPRLKILVYDIGLTNQEYNYINNRGDCTLRSFPFDKFPGIMRSELHTYTWKPLIIQMSLLEFGFVIWMDSSVYIPNGDLSVPIEIAKREGIAIGYRSGLYSKYTLPYYTDVRMFSFFGERPCAFEYVFHFNAGFIAIRRNERIVRDIMRPWVSCALSKSCMELDNDVQRCGYVAESKQCHKFDQSALSIILNRLYYNEQHRIDISTKLEYLKCHFREEIIIMGDTVTIAKDSNRSKCPKVKWITIK